MLVSAKAARAQGVGLLRFAVSNVCTFKLLSMLFFNVAQHMTICDKPV